LLALHASDDELDRLHDFPGAARARGISTESIARCVAERNWHPGKRWARHFVGVLGVPAPFAGFVGAAGGPDFEDVQPHVPLEQLENFQEDLRDQVLGLLSAPAGSNRAILTLPTGAGKTRTTVEALVDWWLAGHQSELILWIAQSEELCEQAVQAFREVWIDRGDRGVRDTIRIYRFWGGRRTVPDEDSAGVVIATVDKLRSSLPERGSTSSQAPLLRIASNLGVIVVDEAHRAEAPEYRHVLGALGVEFASASQSSVPILGLTATPLRSQHDETIRLAKRFYNCLLRPLNLPADPAEMLYALRERGVLSKPTHRVLAPAGHPVRLTEKQEAHLREWKDLPPEVLAGLGQSRGRNRELLSSILELDPTWPVLFFGCSVQHAEAMAVMLRRRGREAAAITAGTRDATRRHLVEAFRQGEIQVLCNYGVLTTGFDAPRVRGIVVGRPTRSRLLYEQMIGRGMRGPCFKGTDECLVIDIDDNLVHLDGRQLTVASQQYAEYWVQQFSHLPRSS
jgi:superfamily II DNA or RNA helicase